MDRYAYSTIIDKLSLINVNNVYTMQQALNAGCNTEEGPLHLCVLLVILIQAKRGFYSCFIEVVSLVWLPFTKNTVLAYKKATKPFSYVVHFKHGFPGYQQRIKQPSS